LSAQPFAWPGQVARTPFHGATQFAPRDSIASPMRKMSVAASSVPNPLSAPSPATTHAASDTLQAARALADAGRLAQAASTINAYLEHHAPHADAFYLLGVLADANGDANLARGHYRKALYLDPQHAEALAHLATSLELEGDHDGARLLMQRAARAQGAQRG
jgi:chemotaxis protein methyltransferase WspC